MSEINPNHPMTQEMHDQWHKIVAILMLKAGAREVLITEDDVALLAAEGDGAAVTVKNTPGGLLLRIVDRETGQRLARENGGLPT